MKVLGHSAHQILITFPVGLFFTAIIFELIALATGSPQFWTVSYWMIAGGLIGGVVAALFGFLDWRHIPAHSRAHRIGILHGLGNAVIVLLFLASWWLRAAPEEAPTNTALVLSFIAAALLLVTGWLGGELVDRLSVGVDEKAHVNATSSLREHAVVEQTTSYRDAA